MNETLTALLPYKGVIVFGILVLGLVAASWIRAHYYSKNPEVLKALLEEERYEADRNG